MTKAVALLSGGLDSTLAVKLMLEHGIDIHALNFTSAFCTCTTGGISRGGCKSESRRVAEEFGIPIKVVVKGEDYIEVVRNPKHGYGKGMNPCVDCRVYMFRQAGEYMREIGASFIVTGEVLGQRPMSQKKENFKTIEKEAGLVGLILRPLCAMHLEPTIPEKTGLVNREMLLAVSGRSRKPQMALAEELGINDYPCPSGGCLLTDKIFSRKVRDLLENKSDVTKRDLILLKIGRHFRFCGDKVIIGRNEADNAKLKNLIQSEDTLVEPVNFAGPVALISGENEAACDFAASLILKYSHDKAGSSPILRKVRSGETEEFIAIPASEDMVEETRVC